MIRVYSEFSRELKAIWAALERHRHVSVFQTVAWCESAWETVCPREKGARLAVIVWTGGNGETPLLLPTFIDRKRRLRFINDEHSDYGDALYEPLTNKYRAFRETVEFIRGMKDVRAVAFQKIRGDSELLGYVGAFMNDATVYRDHAYSYVEIPGNADVGEGLAHFNAYDRKHFGRLLKKASAAVYEKMSFAAGAAFPEERIGELAEVMRGSGIRHRDFFDSRMMAFARRIYEKGICEIAALSYGGLDVAISFRLKKGRRSNCWISLYRDGKWNSPRLAADAKDIAGNGGGVLDLGVGFYGYKQEAFRPVSRIVFSIRWGRGFLEKCYAYLRMNWRFLRVGAR